MDFVRVGDKLLDRRKIAAAVDEILTLRCRGYSQAETARRLGVDRSFVSRLESLGEVRRGRRVAVIGFPLANKEELEKMLEEEGVEYILLLTEDERWEFLRQRSGVEVFNFLMETVARLREFDAVIIIGSDYRIRLSEALLGREVIGVEIGTSPIREDRTLEAEKLRHLVRQVLLPAKERRKR
ncbi:helix-turn-helix domain-containing protein [Thermanaeromonas sp. C210]|uniref:helix-turn-helix domain-containing protein n=1 Tax=Thermanaeromonas sp. C210 TaxID=2731925 RepID=UPI00155BFF81|nr:helix-turn-helix domain-containing protein [Thermanaeromonas sp. C210]GFN22855.1 transcriptional regulator [Thermanaeromonas sp. C210]